MSSRTSGDSSRLSGRGRKRSPLIIERALVLRRFAFGESSLVVHLLTPEHGRVHLVAKGAFRPTSGYFAALDLFDTLEVRWRAKPGGGLPPLSAARVLTSRRHLARDLDRYRPALAVLGLAGHGAREGDADPLLFSSAEQALELLRDHELDPRLTQLTFELRFLETMGVGIALAQCAQCGQSGGAGPASSSGVVGVPFSVERGGRLCDRCAAETRQSGGRIERIGPDLLRIAELLINSTPEALRGLRLTPQQKSGIDRLAARFLAWHVEAGTQATRSLRRRVASGGSAS